MNGKLRNALTECIEAIETGTDAEACLQRYPEQADELRPLLRMWSDLDDSVKAEPVADGYDHGLRRTLDALADAERGGRKRMIPFFAPALVKVAAAVAAVVLLTAGVAGTSAALGGPDIADEILTVTGINGAPEAAQNGKDHANPNAFEGADNAGQGSDNASQQGQDNANPNAVEGADNAGQGSDNASQQGQDNANPNAVEGADNAGQGSDNASQQGQDNANPDAGEGADNAGQGLDNASQQGQDNANPNAGEGADDVGQGSDNASQQGQDNANPDAGEGADDVGGEQEPN
ncbi:MAG: hypothetical protein IH957_05155 [Chloroflexi bacterium]|nr:hypothetical protein [Chloroflexota bacterium]